jgi:succinylarginine dihydrolase
MSSLQEVNFDGLVGPTHNHAGLSHGNIASERHAAYIARPRAAALQGLAKMRTLVDLGIPQAFLPPQMRPDVSLLRAIGLGGEDDAAVVARASREAPRMLAAACSSSFMWTANAATVVPSVDAADGRLHLIPANLISQPHRAFESRGTARMLRKMFRDEELFRVHEPLPACATWADEGAANHTRFHGPCGRGGVHLFVYGADAGNSAAPRPRRYPARQTRETCEALARLACISRDAVILAQQHPDAIDAGVFHNDVIATGHASVHLVHERAFLEPGHVRAGLAAALRARAGTELVWIEVKESEVSMEEVVRTYLFNSQLVTLPGDRLHLVAPSECEASDPVRELLERLVASEACPLNSVSFLNLRESMANGGGPACLRLRVPLNDRERAAVHPGVWLTPSRHAELEAWVRRWYREELAPSDLGDPALADEARSALLDLAAITGLNDLHT